MAEDSPAPGGGSAFPTTQWTVIIEAASTNPERARAALEKLCTAYRQAIVSWFKRKDFYQDPEDLAHSFVAYVIEKSLLTKVAPRTGRFRRFLAACMQRFLWDTWGKKQTPGVGKGSVPLADDDREIAAEAGGDSQFDLDIALAIHSKVMSLLAPQETVKPFIFQKDSSEGWDEIAVRLGKTSAALRQEVSRLRRKHWELFRDEVAQISTPSEKTEETHYLYELLFRNLPA